MEQGIRTSLVSNGIRVVTQKRNTGKVAFIFAAGCGLRFDPDDKVGLSHISEHTTFKRTPSRVVFDIAATASWCGA